jgi:FixJ family two-component response regulator
VTEAPHYIAVVDDEPAVCKAFARLLRAARFEVATFCSGAEFLSSLSARMPACVVLDLHMPVMSGLDVQSRLAADLVMKLPVVVVTAHDSPESQQRVLTAGAVAYLRKPVDARNLLEAIRAGIARNQPPAP